MTFFFVKTYFIANLLQGCDYIDSLPGIGLKKALKFVMKTEETDLMRALDKIPAYLNMRNLTITEEYKINVLKARATFLHMIVFDPRQRRQVRLHEINEFGTDIEYCCNAGKILDDKTALNLAVGNLDPFTFEEVDHWHPNQVGILYYFFKLFYVHRINLAICCSNKGKNAHKYEEKWNQNG